MAKRTTKSLYKAPAHKRPVLLMVEDVAHFHKYVQTLIKYHGISADFISALTIKDAKELILTAEPDFMLLDFVLPDGHADELLGFMDARGIDIPYAIVTQYRKDELIARGIGIEFVEYATALVIKKDLGIWFGEYIQHFLNMAAAGLRWVEDE